MIRMYEDLSPDQMQIVEGRQVHDQHADRISAVLRCVEIVLCGLAIPAVTHLPSEHLGDRRECGRVIDLACCLLNAGNSGDLGQGVGVDAYERHQTRVPYSAATTPRVFETTFRPRIIPGVTVTTWQAPSAVSRCFSSAAAARPSRGRHPRCGVLTCFRSAPH